jgi:hypothetical protein
MIWKIQPIDTGGWWLFYTSKQPNTWWHVHHNKWFPVFPTLDAVFEKIKEKNNG